MMQKIVVAVVALVFGLSFGTVFALDPLNKEDAAKDYDVDGLTNLMEFIYGTDPYNADTDGDGCPDGWVVYYDLNRAWFPEENLFAVFDSDGDGVKDANVDPEYKFNPANGLTAGDRPDSDGWDNLREYYEGTDPTNPDTDHDGWIDDYDPMPLIPNDRDKGNTSGHSQGVNMAPRLAGAWC